MRVTAWAGHCPDARPRDGGHSGQLATALAEQAASWSGIELKSLGRLEIELAQPETLAARILAERPDVVVNAAAHTAVDRAETEPDLAFVVNRDGAAAAAAMQLGIPFIHLSTDYVFSGRKDTPYVETDAVDPVNVYGRSKLAGEKAVLAAHPGALIFRTSWLFSPFGSNFLRTILRVGAERDVVRVVSDQFGNPTSALDLASAILSIAPKVSPGVGGIYHATGAGSASWYEFAALIFAESRKLDGPSPTLEAITTAEYPTAAIRPVNSSLDNSALERRFGVTLGSWLQSVPEVVSRTLADGSHLGR